MKNILLLMSALIAAQPLYADTDATVFWYEELEQGTSPELMRYVVTSNYLRIDNGNLNDNFLLYDHQTRTVYSATHDDRTIMVIHHMPWTMPAFSFSHEVKNKVMDEAPKIAGKPVISYQVFADKELCADIQLLPGMFSNEMKLFQEYKMLMSGQLAGSLHNTPEEYQTPCFLRHQVYNTGEYYTLGLPIQEWHSRGYMRVLKNFAREKVSEDLFKLPPDYQEYSPIGGNSRAE